MRNARVLAWTVLALSAAPAASALDPQRAPSQYVFRKWGAGTELPSLSVHALLQSRDRYLWLGTGSGLVRFDGARFVVFNGRTTPGFGDGVVTTLSEGPDGALYFGMTSAVMRYREGAFTAFGIDVGAGVSSSLLAARDGSVWIGLLGRPLFRWAGGQIASQYRKLDTTGPRAIVEDESGAVWIGTRREGLVRFDGAEYRHLGVTADTIQALAFDRAGALWIGTPHGLLRRDRDGAVARFGEENGLAHPNVSALLEDRDGNVWVGTSGGGVCRYRDGRFQAFTSRHGLTDDDVRAMLEDHEGNLWIGTAEGLNRLSDGRFVTFGRAEGLVDANVTAVAASANGDTWIGTAGGTLARLHAGAVRRYTLPGGPGKENILALHEDRGGRVWIGFDNGRLFSLEGETVRERTDPAAPNTWKASTLAEDEHGPLVFITGVGLSRMEGRRAVPLHETRPRLGFAYQILKARDGTTWIAASLGLARVRGDEYKVYTQKDGLPHERVRSAMEDEDGSLWLATIGGLAHLEGDRIRSLTRRQGLHEDHLRLVLDDGLGYLWLGSVSAISRVAKKELRDVLDGRSERVHPVVFDTSDGLRTTEMALSSSPGFRAADGRLWFATAMGASVVDPARVSVGDPAPRVVMERVTVDGQAGRAAEASYPPGRGEVTIEYTSLGFRSASRQLFRYRLDGLDPAWVDAGARRAAYYSNLPPGRYRFSVTASNRDGLWNGEPTSIEIALRPPFYRTPVFYAAAATLAAGLIALGHRLRVNRMRARFAGVLRERTRIARELHDTLAQGLAGVGMQMDTALKMLPDAPGLERVRAQIERGRSVIRMSLAEVRRSIWVLRAQTARDANDLASSLSQNLAHLTADSGIGAQVNVSGRARPLSSEVEHNLLRIAHEAVTNAVRHSGAKTITVGVHFDDDHVDLEVRDDGRGFDADTTREKMRGVHFGLEGLSERTRALGGELRLSSAPGAGTQIECRLPYRNRGADEDPGLPGAAP